MKKLLIYVVPFALAAAHASAAPSSGWGGIGAFGSCCGDRRRKGRAFGAGAASWRWRRRRPPGQSTGATSTAANVNRGNFNSANFQRDVSANRNVVGEPQRKR